MPPKPQKSKEAKAIAAASGSKGKKKKWSKGKVRDKLNNLVLFDKDTYQRLLKEVPSYKLITPAVLSERLKLRGSLARAAIRELQEKGLIRVVESHSAQYIYTRATKAEDEPKEEAAAEKAPAKGKGGKGGKAPKAEAAKAEPAAAE